MRAPAAAVYAMFTDPAELVRWLGIRALLEPRPGGLFRFAGPLMARIVRRSIRGDVERLRAVLET